MSQQCQPKAVRASIVLSNGTVYCEIELKRMDWILESSAASAFEFSGNVGLSMRQACARTNSQHDECICFRTSSAIRSCCCINDWTTRTTKKIGEVEFSRLFSTTNAACDKVAMAEGITDFLSAGAHQRRFSFVVPAGNKDRMGMARRLMALGFRLKRSLSTERPILRFMLCSGSENISGPDSSQFSNKSLAVDWPSNPSFAISVTAKGMYPNAASNLETSGSFSEPGLISW